MTVLGQPWSPGQDGVSIARTEYLRRVGRINRSGRSAPQDEARSPWLSPPRRPREPDRGARGGRLAPAHAGLRPRGERKDNARGAMAGVRTGGAAGGLALVGRRRQRSRTILDLRHRGPALGAARVRRARARDT